jgi:transcription initiation factor TFIID subunit 1, fungi type
MSTQDENEAISALTGFSLNHILTDLSLPSGSGLSNQLGITGNPSLNPSQIYGDKWDDEGAVGPGQGEDWEDEVDKELEDEEDVELPVKMEVDSPGPVRRKQRRVRVVKRLVERPKTVYERFPAFEKDKVLDFSELFKGYTGKKSRLVKKPFNGASCPRVWPLNRLPSPS